ncbi:alpha/beta fold hydrolase [soil metagenome]
MPTLDVECLRVPLSPPQSVAGTSGLLWRSEGSRPGLVLAHAAGSSIADPVLRAVSRRLAESGHPVLCFNFAYAELGQKRPDPPARLRSAFRDAITVARRHVGSRSLLLGGRSMGGRVASLLAAEGHPCAGLVLLGYPLHPVGRPESLRTAHWPQLSVPALFVQGDRDRLCDLDRFEAERAGLPSADLHVVRGADHGFRVRRSDGRDPAEILDEVVGAVTAWLRRRTAADAA